MGRMDISTRLEFAAPPPQVAAMLTDEQYLDEVCRATHSTRYEVAVTGSTTRTSRTFPAPASVARFVGGELTVSEQVTWGEAAADGSRTGELQMTVPGQPVTLAGRLQLSPGGPGTVVELTGNLKAAIPLFGGKIEQSAAPAVLAGFSTQQEVGERWLAREATGRPE